MSLGKVLSLSVLSAALLAVTLGLASGRQGIGLELGSLFVLMWYGLNLVVAAAFGLGRWSSMGWRALAPGAVLLAALPGVPSVKALDRELTDFTFGRHLQQLEAGIAELTLLPGEVSSLGRGDLPDGTQGCCNRAVVRRDSEDRLSAVFVVTRRLAYLYDPTGVGLRRAVRRWHQHEPVAPNWYRLQR
jgi:hypothetical protein